MVLARSGRDTGLAACRAQAEEADSRVIPEPHSLLLLTSQLGLLALLHRRTQKRRAASGDRLGGCTVAEFPGG